MSTRIVISGYYGFDNVGDELILYSLINQLKSIKGKTEIVVLSAQPDKTTKEFEVWAINRWNFIKIFKEIGKADFLISGGGGLLQDKTGLFSIYYYLAIILLAKLLGKEIIIYSQGIGPLKNRFNRYLVKSTLHSINKISVRDYFSRDLLFSLGLPQTELSADPVFSLHPAIVGNGRPPQADKAKPTPEKIWGLIPRPGDRSVKEILIQTHSLAEKYGAVLRVVPFQLCSSELNFVQKIIRGFPKLELRLWKDWEDLLSIFSELNLIISWRYHGILLASLYQKPVVGIGNDPKIKSLLKELDRECFEYSPDSDFTAFLNRNMFFINYPKVNELVLRAKYFSLPFFNSKDRI